MKPKISVCTITYGHESYIEKCIEGVLNQVGDFDLEFVISNDKSPDTTSEIVKKYIQTHSKGHCIRFLDRKENIGIMPNFYDTLNQCTGNFIAICDGDDYWTDPHKLQKQLDFLNENKNFILCGHNIRIFDNQDEKIVDESFPFKHKHSISSELIYKRNYIPAVSIFFRNNHSLPDWFLQSPIGDYPLILFLSQFGEIGFQADLMADYRKFSGYHSRESTEKKKRMLIDALKLTSAKIELREEKFKSLLNEQILKLEMDLQRSFSDKVSLILKSDLSFALKIKNILLCLR